MSDPDRTLGRMDLSRVKTRRNGVVLEGESGGAELYSIMADLELLVRTGNTPSEVFKKIDDETRLVILVGHLDENQLRRTCRVIRKRRRGWSIVILILSAHYGDRDLAIRHQQLWDADLCLPSHAPKKMLSDRLTPALRTRCPIAELPGLPRAVGANIDLVFDRIHHGDYYQLFDVKRDASTATVRGAFHRWAELTHPDRHRSRTTQSPISVKRITDAYKRLSEAHSVLTDPLRRRVYDLCLQSGLSHRYEPERLDERIRKEFDMCQTDTGRLAVIESLFARMNGDWQKAAKFMRGALEAEPSNQSLMDRAASVAKVSKLASPIQGINETNGGSS